jgi:hypothetical protein
LISLLELQSLKYPELKELRDESQIEIPQRIKLKYYPRLKTHVFESNLDIKDLISLDISENKKEVLLSICSQDSDCFTVEAQLNQKNGIFNYIVLDSQNKQSTISNFLSNKTLAFAIASSIAIGTVGGNFVSKNHKSIVKRFTQKETFLSHYSLAMTELEKIQDNPKLFEVINNVSSQELDYLSKILEHKDLSDVQEGYKDIIVDKVKDLISSVQTERIKFKTQKKVQSDEHISQIAEELVSTSIDHEIDYRILTSIIMQESKFDQGEVSSSGDITMVQINYEIWKPEFDKMNLELDRDKLKKDEKYALWAMGVILSKIKKSYADKDPYWFARYHNNNKKRKFSYATLVNSHFSNFNKNQISDVSQKIDNILMELKIIDFDKYNDVDKSLITKMIQDLIKVKINIEASDIPSNIAAN